MLNPGRLVAVLCFLLFASPTGVLVGQETDPPARADALEPARAAADSAGAPDTESVSDTLAVPDTTSASDSIPVSDSRGASDVLLPPAPTAGADSAGPVPPISPMGAFFRSLILPGWGQISADQPGRGAFYFAMEAGSLWMLLKTNAKLNAAKRSNPLDEDLVSARQDQFEDWATLAVFWALFSGVDAWVSAQLWDFTGEVIPPPDGSSGAAFQYSIPVGP
ncbi:MAG: hypothetical protein P8049_06355 [Gemmatimonadota bacterium]